MKKILLITSGQPSLNPRLIKEADSLFDAGYDVSVMYLYWNDWGTKLDIKLLNQKKWLSIRVGGNPKTSKWIYWQSRINHKVAKILASKFGFNYRLAEQSIARGSVNLIRKAKSLKADLYIAHNLGALPAAVLAAKKYHSNSGFDAEDFHRQEVTDDHNAIDFKLKKFIEDKYFPKIDYITTSSPLISEQYQSLFPKLSFNTILNVFPIHEVAIKPNKDYSGLRLFWFSQHIGLSRGLQDVIYALKHLEHAKIELHLLGSLSLEVKTALNEIISDIKFDTTPNIFFYEPIAPEALFKFASQFDIGLATEPAFSLNNDSALSNKIFTYIQSGLSLIVSDTTAQKQLLEEYPNMGMVYKKNSPSSLVQVLQAYINDRALLLEHQQQAALYAEKTLNWEVEKQKFLSLVKKTLNT